MDPKYLLIGMVAFVVLGVIVAIIIYAKAIGGKADLRLLPKEPPQGSAAKR